MLDNACVTDEDECMEGTANCLAAVSFGACTNSIGSYICSCMPGYEGDGQNTCTGKRASSSI